MAGILTKPRTGLLWTDLGTIVAGDAEISGLAYLGGGICLGLTDTHIARSIDYGKTWVNQYTPSGFASPHREIIQVANGICLAGAYRHVLRSTDYGLTWSEVDIGSSITTVGSLAYLGGGICLAGGSGQFMLARSTDSGETWADLGAVVSGETGIKSLVYLGDGICLAGTDTNAKIARSIDYGLTWTDLGRIISKNTSVLSLAYLGNGICLAGTGSGSTNAAKIARSTDYGLTWSEVRKRAPASGIGDINMDGYVDMSDLTLLEQIILGTATVTPEQIRRADVNQDGAVNELDITAMKQYMAVCASAAQVKSLAYLGNGICLAGTAPDGKLARSIDYGLTWTDLGTLISGETWIDSLVYLESGVCLAGTYPNGKVARSELRPFKVIGEKYL